MRLQVSTSKNACLYYVAKSFRTSEGKSSSKIVERLGSMEELITRFGSEDPIGKAKEYVAALTREEKEKRKEVIVKYSPVTLIDRETRRSYNGGYLFLQKIYHDIGLHKICAQIEKRHKERSGNHELKYDLSGILSRLLYTRVLYPGSKLSSFEDSKRFIEQPRFELHQIYRALSLLAQESDFIQAQVYKNRLKLGHRSSKVIYYDCTNYYFESEQERGLRQYGISKEHRPNPIVQMGLFMDMDGMPLAFSINPGNTNEQVTLRPLEQKLNDHFNINRLVVCTDSGLSSYENRKSNNISQRAFITVQSLKRLKRHLQEWALESRGWKMANAGKEEYDLSMVDARTHHDTLFYKDRWINENGLEQRLIVTFSFKYRDYLRYLRDGQIERAERLMRGTGKRLERRNHNDPKRFIEQIHYTPDGELAQATSYSLNRQMIEQEEAFDGFYGICTNLEDRAVDIIRVNSGRWMIENAFRLMKTEFEARPVFLQRDERIKAHFLTCFLALLLFKCLEKRLNRGMNKFTPSEIISTLTDMNFLNEEGEGYIPSYTRTDLTDALHGSTGFRTDTGIVPKQRMREIISATKNSRSSMEKEKRRSRDRGEIKHE